MARFTGCGKRGWDKTRLHLERGRHSFLWSSDELSKPTCKELGAQNFKQIEIFLSPFLSVSNCPGDLTESCYTRCDFRSLVSGFNNVFIFIAIIFGCLGILKSFVVALPAEAAARAAMGAMRGQGCARDRDACKEAPSFAWGQPGVQWECLAFPALMALHHIPPAGQRRNQPGWFNRYEGIRDCSWDLGRTCPNGAALIQSKTKPTNQGQPQRLQLAGNPSGEVQVLGRKKIPALVFFNILNIYVYIKKTFLESEVTRAYSKREKGKEDFHRPCPCHHTFLFISDKRDSTPPTYYECKHKASFLPKVGGRDRGQRSGNAC